MHRLLKSVWFTTLPLLLVLALTTPLRSGMRGPGKYSGVVVFDRWDTCFLLSGPYVTYISSAAKEALRPYTGMAVQIEATRVFQPVNPGDAIIREYKIIGSAPESKLVRNVAMRLDPAFHDGIPAFRISFRNTGNADVWLRADEVGIAVMGEKRNPESPSNGRSEAVITRVNLASGSSGGEWVADGHAYHAYYKREYPSPLPVPVRIAPQSVFEAGMTLDISPGEYQVVIGYGGGVHEEESIASNTVSFRLEFPGLATLE